MIPGATDCHHHICDNRYPTVPRLPHVPPDASVAVYQAVQRRLGLSRNVIVQPSAYGTDNRCAVDALAAFGPAARGVAVVDTGVTDAELARLHAAGVRGVRFNLVQAAATTPDMLRPLEQRMHELGWHIQLNLTADQVVQLAGRLEALPCPVVLDHCAHIPHPAGAAHPAFAAVQRLLSTGRTWVKLSGPCLDSREGPPAYADVSRVARRFATFAPIRVVWGSDWPHPTARGDKPDDATLLAWLDLVVPDPSARERILVDNSAALYGFD